MSQTIRVLGQPPEADPSAVRALVRGKIPLVALLASASAEGAMLAQATRLRCVRFCSMLLLNGINVYAPAIEFDALDDVVGPEGRRRLQHSHLARCDAVLAVPEVDGGLLAVVQELMLSARAMGIPVYVMPVNAGGSRGTGRDGLAMADLVRSLRDLGFDVRPDEEERPHATTSGEQNGHGVHNTPDPGRGDEPAPGGGSPPCHGEARVPHGPGHRPAPAGSYDI